MPVRAQRIVVIGGGNGSAIALRALRHIGLRENLSAIIAVSDSGGSSGILRRDFHTLPPGDVLRAVLALSRYDYDFLKDLFYASRFSDLGILSGHNVGNLFLAGAAQYANAAVPAIRALEKAVGAEGRVYPATLADVTLMTELTNGDIVKGEHEIDVPTHDRSCRIARAWLEPNASAYEDAMRVIREADAIILGPGSLYTSIIAALLPVGIGGAIRLSPAKIIHIAGSMYRITGETGPTTLSESVRELQAYVPRHIDTVLYHAQTASGEGRVRMDADALEGYHLVEADLEQAPGEYDTVRLGDALRRCLIA
jgi:uncharacterized cofD-like protein